MAMGRWLASGNNTRWISIRSWCKFTLYVMQNEKGWFSSTNDTAVNVGFLLILISSVTFVGKTESSTHQLCYFCFLSWSEYYGMCNMGIIIICLYVPSHQPFNGFWWIFFGGRRVCIPGSRGGWTIQFIMKMDINGHFPLSWILIYTEDVMSP